jgi:hypothetical protein
MKIREEYAMKMNLENLIYMVQEHLEDAKYYHRVRLECWEKQNGQLRKIGCTSKNHPLYVDHLKGEDAAKFAKYYERSKCGWKAISDFCDILGIDRGKLYYITRAIQRWHEKRDWQVCFPFTERNNKTILEYLQTQ